MSSAVFQAYVYATSAYLAIQAIPLVLTPKLMVSMLSSEPRHMTDLESYLSRSLGFSLLLAAQLCILLSGAVPLSTRPGDDTLKAQAGNVDGITTDARVRVTLIVTTVYHALVAFYLYTQIATGFSFGFGVGMMVETVLFGMGLWVLLFGNEKGHVSKRTGADKRTSGILFPRSAKRSR